MNISFKKKYSLTRSIILCLLCCIIPLNILLLSFNVYSTNVLRRQIAESYHISIDSRANSLDRQFYDLELFLSYLYLNNIDIKFLKSYENPNDIYHLAYNINLDMSTRMQTDTLPDVMFVAKAPAGQIQYSRKHSFPTIIAESCSRYLKKSLSDYSSFITDQWFIADLDSLYFLMRIVGKDGTYVGALVYLENLNINISLNSAKDLLFISDREGVSLTNRPGLQAFGLSRVELSETYELGGTDNGYLILSKALENAPINVVYATPDTEIMGSLGIIQKLFFALATGSFLLLPLAIFYLRKTFLVPLANLKKIILQIKSGELDSKIGEADSIELDEVYSTFNSMMDEINHFKILSYEEQLNHQKYQLQYLRLQLKPHFYLNALKGLYSLAEKQNFKAIQEMLLHLSEHFRYIAYNTMSLVPLKEELYHTKNYVALQQLGNNLPICCSLSMENRFSDFKVPSLSIQTFVENSIKYGTVAARTIKIDINVTACSNEDGSYLQIRITDNGNGYSHSLLEAFKNIRDNKFENKHIGLANLSNRLSLIYGGKAYLILSNARPHGASAEMFIPATDCAAASPDI